ncbi:WD40 repeat domain-containing protein [archaeon]|nr:MAG: WD40 repeat domain-containing protein [archaeon]
MYELYEHSKELVVNLSQFGDDRPLTSVRYTSDQSFVISGSWANTVKLWSATTLAAQGNCKGHSERVNSVAQSAHVLSSQHKYIVASGSADSTALLWDMTQMTEGMDSEDSIQDGLLHKLEGHKSAVSCVDFHPHYAAVATASHDFSWRLWDMQTGSQLLLQDGHVKDCTALSFHVDGSILVSGDAGGVVLCWDLRSGQMIQGFAAHGKKITEINCNSNGFHVATSSVDNTVKIWDLRRKKQHYTLPAHSHVISGVRYSPSGELLMTCSFDGTLKIWGARDYRILRTLPGHEGKVMSADFAPDERHLVSAGYDRTIKLWAHKDEF